MISSFSKRIRSLSLICALMSIPQRDWLISVLFWRLYFGERGQYSMHTIVLPANFTQNALSDLSLSNNVSGNFL